jgi:peptide-methionine (S)-S-oxide reductase
MTNFQKILFSLLLFICTKSVIAGPQVDTAVFAGGCFWGVDAVFKHVKGVSRVVSGYAGGATSDPTYSMVSSGRSGHAESVMVTYDPQVVSYKQLLAVFFKVAHDPTQLNRQGPDWGTQYRSAVFYTNAEQHKLALNEIQSLTKENIFQKPIVTEVSPLSHFYPAEGYHQNYLASHMNQPYIVVNDLPKIGLLKKTYPDLYMQSYPQ